MRSKLSSGGFVLIEFAIALPLLILLFYCLELVTFEIVKLDEFQIADYGLEEEAQYVMERIIQEARVAKKIKITEITDDIHKIKIVYHAVDDTIKDDENFYEVRDENNNKLWYFSNKDVWETRYFIPHMRQDDDFFTLYAKRKDDGYYLNPITGNNSFGKTKIKTLKYEFDKDYPKILHITLEMAVDLNDSENMFKEQKIEISTAVFIPGLED